MPYLIEWPAIELAHRNGFGSMKNGKSGEINLENAFGCLTSVENYYVVENSGPFFLAKK
jgi:hypothetical protein